MVATSQAPDATRVTWQINPSSTYVQFDIRHMLVCTVRGRFPDVRGTIVVDHVDPAASTVEMALGAASVDTGHPTRDEYVRGEAVLDADRHPTIAFRSTRIEPLGDGRARVMGTLSIRGVGREVVLDARYSGAARAPFGGWVAGFEGRTTLALADFGVTGNLPMPDGGLALGEDVAVELIVEAVRAE